MSGERRRSSRPLLIALVGVTMLAGSCAGGPAAFAGGAWKRPVPGRVLVAYGDACPGTGGASRIHQGVDLACGAGDGVVACEGGTVSFSGPVPSDSGGRVTAVTVTGDDGLRVTYTPLATAAVAAGRRVETGSAIGMVAGEGDASSSAAHLHLSVRRGETYLDPAGMLAGASGSSDVGGPGAGGDGGGAGKPGPNVADAPTAESHVPAGAPAAQAAPAPAGSVANAAVAAGSTAAASTAAGALASLTSLRAAPALAPAAAVRAVTGRVSLLAPLQARAGMTVPLPHATGLAAIAGSASSLGRAATTAAIALVVGLAVLGCAWRSLWSFAGRAASVTASAGLQTVTTTPVGRE